MAYHASTQASGPGLVAIDQGYLSPPSSGRPDKQDKPRLGHPGAAVVPAHPAFDQHKPTSNKQLVRGPELIEHVDGTLVSPNRKNGGSLNGGDDRMLTPPQSRDTRMDGGQAEKGHDAEAATRVVSDAESETSVSRTCSHKAASDTRPRNTSSTASRKRLRGPVAAGDSDVEDNPFFSEATGSSFSSRQRTSGSRSHDTLAHAELSADDADDYEEDEATPKAAAAPLVRRRLIPAQPIPADERVRVDSQDVSGLHPIRDTPLNPFIEGGPADQGFHGPQGSKAAVRALNYPGKERGKITYVFRGQRVTYADPEYDSDDSDEYVGAPSSQRPQRLQPKLLFPTPDQARALAPAPAPRGGLFAAELASRENGKRRREEYEAEERQGEPCPKRLHKMTGEALESERESAALRHAQSHTSRASADDKHAERSALLARLEQTNWSDDDEDDDEDAEGEDDITYSRSSGAADAELAAAFPTGAEPNGFAASSGLASRMKGR